MKEIYLIKKFININFKICINNDFHKNILSSFIIIKNLLKFAFLFKFNNII